MNPPPLKRTKTELSVQSGWDKLNEETKLAVLSNCDHQTRRAVRKCSFSDKSVADQLILCNLEILELKYMSPYVLPWVVTWICDVCPNCGGHQKNCATFEQAYAAVHQLMRNVGRTKKFVIDPTTLKMASYTPDSEDVRVYQLLEGARDKLNYLTQMQVQQEFANMKMEYEEPFPHSTPEEQQQQADDEDMEVDEDEKDRTVVNMESDAADNNTTMSDQNMSL